VFLTNRLALAYRSCCILGYNKPIMTAGSESSVKLEIGRRCFWACWASMCIAGEPKAYLRSAWLEVDGLPLPAGTSDHRSTSKPEIAEKMDQNWHCSMVEETVTDLQRPKCCFAELMKILGVWQVHSFQTCEIKANTLPGRRSRYVYEIRALILLSWNWTTFRRF
jgi:hypothetical protein